MIRITKRVRKNIFLWAAILTIIVGVVTLIGLLPKDGSSSEQSEASSASTPVAHADEAGNQGADSVVTCLSIDGDDVSCSTPGSGVLAIGLTQCDLSSVTNLWGYTDSDQLLIETKHVSDGCLVLPASLAVEAGAGGLDVAGARDGEVGAALRECARRDGIPSVACSAPHELEFVSGWTATTSVDMSGWCRDLVIDYAGNPLDARSALRSMVLSAADGRVRCAVGAEGATLDGSVRDIGGGELPRS